MTDSQSSSGNGKKVKLGENDFMIKGKAEGIELYREDSEGFPDYVVQDYQSHSIDKMEQIWNDFEKESDNMIKHYWQISESGIKLRDKINNQIITVAPTTQIQVATKDLHGFNLLYVNTSLNDFEPEDDSWLDYSSIKTKQKEDVYDLSEFYKELEQVAENSPYLLDDVDEL